ncbi:MAG: Unknown protein [uncultured Sulfurovum sp.]|uniref:Uncharacterized protein n=1 Tax=uncultured Sulfurovum sp. TaxID=269237 RepID=A0A6S6S0M7_9BACT|nr:MAG: Unknown protein [uncultured Sulfurovum sp.]
MKKINNLSIEFATIINIEKTHSIFKPFISSKYQEIFFKEMILDEDDFSIYISDAENLVDFYTMLEEFHNHQIVYQLSYHEPKEDEYGFKYLEETKLTLDELKKLEIVYKKPHQTLTGFDFKINDFALSPDGKYLATATNYNIFIWCAKCYKFLAHHLAWDGVAEKIYFTPNSKYLITLINDIGSWQNTIQVWEPLGESVTKWEWLQEDDFDIEYSKDEMKKLDAPLPYLLSSLVQSCYGGFYNFYREFYSNDFLFKAIYYENSLALYHMDKPLETEASTLLSSIELFSKVEALSFSNNSKYLCIGLEEDIEIFDTKELKQLKILESHQEKITALALSPDNQYLLSASLDQTLKLWSLEGFELLTTIKSNLTKKITAIQFSSDSTKIFASSKEGIKIWDVKTQEALFHLFNDNSFWCLLNGEEELLEKGMIPCD